MTRYLQYCNLFIHHTSIASTPSSFGSVGISSIYILCLFLALKLISVVNAVGQLAFAIFVIGINPMSLVGVATGNEWQIAKMFPRVIWCEFEGRTMANQQERFSVMCALPANSVFEKVSTPELRRVDLILGPLASHCLLFSRIVCDLGAFLCASAYNDRILYS